MSKLTEAFRVLAHAFPRWDLEQAAIRTWTALLSDHDVDSLYAAAVELARTSKFAPTIAEWRERAAAMSGRGAVATFGPAEAWAEVERNRALSQRQRYESRPEKRIPPTWTNDAVRVAAEIVVWNGDRENETLPTVRAQFERYYRELCAKGAAVEGAKSALEFAPQVEALLERPILRRVEDHR